MIFYFPAIVGAILGLRRKCPRCGRDQIVPRQKKYETLKCKFCGKDVPPKKRVY